MIYFDTYGPFQIQRNDKSFTGQQAAFWKEIETEWPGLSKAIGCYLFCLEHANRIRPWYVGQTRSRNGFSGEAFQEHKRLIYSEILKAHNGMPQLFFFPLLTRHEDQSRRRFSNARESSKGVIDWLETTLMTLAHHQNPNISNIRDMNYTRNVEVLGLFGKRRGRPYREAQEIKHALLGAKRSKSAASISDNA